MKVIPIGDKVVIQRVEPEERTRGGIVLPETAQRGPTEGRVLSVGDGVQCASGTRVGFQVQEGDRILFSSYGGTELEVDGQKLLILSESDVLAVVS